MTIKGIQEALGMDAPNHMKGLQVFIADIRNCPTKEQEEKRVQKELAKIRVKFTTAKSISGYDKKKYVWKLLYAYMLGYDVDFGHIQAVELCSSPKFSEKVAGYLAISLLLSDNVEILRLVVNSIKNDMASRNEHIVALVLNTVANIGGAEFSDNLWGDVSKIILAANSQVSPYIKRKACICLLRLYRRDQDALQPEIWRKKLAALFLDRDVGLLTSVSGFMLAILEQGKFPVSEWSEIIPAVTQCLGHMVQGDCPEHYEYYSVAAPWLQTKLLRIEQFFEPHQFDSEILQRLNLILHNILVKQVAQRSPATSGSKHSKRNKADAERQNRCNSEHSILFEAMNLMIHLEDRCDPETTRMAAGLLGGFISSSDPNIRYLGLETMARLATNIQTHEYLEKYKNLILEKMHETDVSIRRQALNLLYALCRPENWQEIVDELLEILSASDPLLQEELVLKIAILAEKNAPNFRWYVDVVFRMLANAPESVGDDVWFRVVQVVTGFDDGVNDSEKQELQRHAATKAYQSLTTQYPHETLVKLSAYLMGEFGHKLPKNTPPKAKLDVLSKHYTRGSPQVRAIIVLAAVKLLNANDDLRGEVTRMLEDIQDEQDVELQQRSCELLHLVGDEALLEDVLCPMPQYAESVQQNNPLVQRLKFQMKSRAHTRHQLEEAAKSEGGVFRPGTRKAATSYTAEPENTSRNPENMLQLTNGSPHDEESGSESGSDEDEGHRNGPAPAGAPATAELWKQLCLVPLGKWFVSPSLCLELKQEYNTHMGRLTILFVNNGTAPIPNVRVTIPDAPFMQMQQFNEAPASLGPKQQGQHLVQVQCMRPFLNPARYLVEFQCPVRGLQQIPLMLPAIMTRFVTPADVTIQQFRGVYETLTQPAQEVVSIGQAKQPPNSWPNYITKGFNLSLLRESTPAAAFCAGTLHTGTPDPSQPGKMITVILLVRLEYDEPRRMVRLTVRSQHGECAQALSKIVESYLVTPAPANA